MNMNLDHDASWMLLAKKPFHLPSLRLTGMNAIFASHLGKGLASFEFG